MAIRLRRFSTGTAMTNLQSIIERAWDGRDKINLETTGPVREAVDEALNLLDQGKARVAEKQDGEWLTNQWLKKAVLLSFRLNDMALVDGGPGNSGWWDKVPSKFEGWGEKEFRSSGFRAVPNCIVRRSAYVAPGAILMPSFVNLGAYVDAGTMVDTWVTVGSCAQIGKNVHLSGGVGIGGVLEPMQASPTIIEDNCFIGARSEVVEGVVVGEGSVISMGVFIGQSTKIVDRATGEVFMGTVPPYSVVVSGSLPQKPYADGSPSPSLYCAVIVKRVDEKTRSKTSINELLRD
jgi:2,3,4,5-tetrahydropyridine-2,6-dicarboxylate N-succinyltransferase